MALASISCGKVFFVLLVYFVCYTDCSVNPKPQYRVIKFWGIEEPASAFFSLATLLTLIASFRAFCSVAEECKASRDSEKYPYLNMWKVYAITFCFSFFSSVWFHWQENRLNEKMDYLFAMAGIIVLLFVAIARVFSLESAAKQVIVAVPFVLWFAYYVLQMLTVKFDYGW